MTRPSLSASCVIAIVIVSIGFAHLNCEASSPTEAIIRNEFSSAAGTPEDAPTLSRVWYRSTLWQQTIAPGADSERLRVGAGTERAYAILNVGSRSFVVVSRTPIMTPIGETTTIRFSPSETFASCFTAQSLSREDYDFVTSRIFPGTNVEAFDVSCDVSATGTEGDGGTADAVSDR